MKKFLLVIGLIATLFTITACNSNKNLNDNNQGGTSENSSQDKPINNMPSTLAGVYTTKGELYQLPMGTDESAETKHLIDFTAPLDAVSFCMYIDENFKNQSFKSRGNTLRSTIDSGLFQEGHAVTYFSGVDVVAAITYSAASSANPYEEYNGSNLFDYFVRDRNDSYKLDIERFGEDYLKIYASENLNTPTRAYYWVTHHQYSKIEMNVLIEIDEEHIINIRCNNSLIFDVLDEKNFVDFAKNLYNLVTIK